MPTDDPSPVPRTASPPRSAAPPRGAALLRIIALIILISLIITAAVLLIFTPQGKVLLEHPKEMRPHVVTIARDHPLLAPLAYMLVYAVLGMLALPVWWLQGLGGMAFGLIGGVVYSQIASTVSAVLSARFSHWLAADIMHRIEDRLHRLRSLDETFGHNGLLVVMAVRLTHVLPFGLSNYAFGLTTMESRDIAWGTLLGGLPAVAVYVAIGVGDKPLKDWRYIVGIVVLNILLLIPLAVHYFWNKATDS
ncbi:MAG: TVP38/TMEM64 family protein [Phycisphaerae bacterium]|nr:TVP38/TMEM64 family protein [Phycisphaerae bacterium]